MKEKINRTDIIEDSNISETENEVLNKENFELETSSVNKEKTIELPIGESSVKEDFTPQNIETDDDFDIFA